MKLFILLQILFNFQEGDLLFQDCQCGAICEAIEDVTQLNDKRRFSHMAIVVGDSGQLKVIEANVQGVKMVSLDSFLNRYTDKQGHPRIAVGRVEEDYEYLIPKVVEFVKSKLDMEYDYEFKLNNDKFYCSELIYEAFYFANMDTEFFAQNRMTFKKYKTKEFHPVFVEYYRNQKKKIPEGKLGTNPAQLSRDKRLKITYLY